MARSVGAGLFTALLLISQLAVADTDDADALLAFKAGVTDPTGALASWNATAHLCRWSGVTCTDGRVTSLDVSERRLTGTLSPAVGNLTYLETLNLTANGMSGPIPASLGRLRRLSYLSLCDNAFSGTIPAALRNCTALSAAYLNSNRLTGGVPPWLGALRNLTFLRLSINSLSGSIPSSLTNLTRLYRLKLDQNLLQGTVPDGLWRLASLQLFSVYQNRLSGEIPPVLFNMSSLIGLAVTNNAFRGELPPDAGARWPDLQYLFLGGNRLTGPIPASLSEASRLQVLSLANNSFSGEVPPAIGNLCLQALQLSNNELTADAAGGWEFLEGLTGCSSLTEISLDGNEFAGAMPGSVIARLSPQLQTLNLAGNGLSGAIPPGIGNLAGLLTLDLDSNLLSGVIPEGIGRLKNLQELWLQHNELTGPVPSSVGNLTQLLSLDLSNNSLNGSIPPSLGNLHQLTLLNLSGNELTGHVPEELFGLPSLSSAMDLSDNGLDGTLPGDVGKLVKLALLALSGNRFSGEVPSELGTCASLEFLDLDSNLFTGTIPSSLKSLKGLRRLNLTSNRLSGSIPPELAQMLGLQELYLSRNDLSGGVPEELENMSSLTELDLSYNHLDGPVPARGVFANATGFQMASNRALCGGAARLRLPPCPPANSTRRGHTFLKIALPIIAGLALCFAVLITLLCYCRKRNSSTADTTARSVLNGNNHPRVSYAELARATDNFAAHNLIGAGKYGSVYRGALSLKTKGSSAREDVVVAVKVFHLRQLGASKTFLSECEALRSVKHRNLISIVTCCSSIDVDGDEFRALVLDFMPNSSLDRWLHPISTDIRKGRVLNIIQRLNVAVDIADALNYLHNNCRPPIIHCDLKPGNVFLADDMTACIGDFGLAKLILDPACHAVASSESTIGVRGTVGYVAPGNPPTPIFHHCLPAFHIYPFFLDNK
jgi:Leucine-rich repeat (LRR) protein